MSSKAFRKLGITAVDDKEFPPKNGVLIRIDKSLYSGLKEQVQATLNELLGTAGIWTAGGAGSFDPEHPYFKKGSNKIDSGDLDIYLDSTKIKNFLRLDPNTTEKDLRKEAANIFSKKFPTTQIGTEVHIAYPAGSEINNLPTFYQVDLNIHNNAEAVVQHHTHDYSVKGSPYTGQDKQLALSSLANTVPGYPERTFLYYGAGGALKNRGTGEVIAQDIDQIAKILLGPNGTRDDLRNVESIIDAVGGLNSPRLAQFRNDLDKKQPPKANMGTNEWFRNLMTVLNETEFTGQLTAQQQKLLEPYKNVDPTDGSVYYDLPPTDPKEVGAKMQPTIKSPEYVASVKKDQPRIIAQLLQTNKNPVQPAVATSQAVDVNLESIKRSTRLSKEQTAAEAQELDSMLRIARLK